MSEPVTPDPSLYTTIDELKMLMGIDPVTSAADTLMNARLAGLIGVVSRSIDIYCRRHFYEREETRIYTIKKDKQHKAGRIWLGYDLLQLHSMKTLGSTEIVFDPSMYILQPQNQTVKAWIDLKFEFIYGLPWSISREEETEVEITGTWGFVTPESLAMLKSACQLWVMELNQRTLYPGAQSVSIGDYSYSFRGDSEQRMSTPNGQTILMPPGQVALLLNGFRRLDVQTMTS